MSGERLDYGLERQRHEGFIGREALGHGWPRYTANGDAHFVLDLPPSTGAHLDAGACDFWDSLSRF